MLGLEGGGGPAMRYGCDVWVKGGERVAWARWLGGVGVGVVSLVEDRTRCGKHCICDVLQAPGAYVEQIECQEH